MTQHETLLEWRNLAGQEKKRADDAEAEVERLTTFTAACVEAGTQNLARAEEAEAETERVRKAADADMKRLVKHGEDEIDGAWELLAAAIEAKDDAEGMVVTLRADLERAEAENRYWRDHRWWARLLWWRCPR
jgi:multidrug efflux pump subunit AcrA (membrane-fusion protein)